MPNELGIYEVRGGGTGDVAGFVLVVALLQAILLPLLLPVAVASRAIFGKPWMVQVHWADVTREIEGGSWSESAALIRSLVLRVEETGSLLGSPFDPR